MSLDEENRERDERDRDLGFGAVVARQSGQRLLNRDGTFNVKRRGLGLRASLSLYYSLLTMSWPRFLLVGMVGYLVLNALFATGYYLLGPEALAGDEGTVVGGRWLQSFFFSVQTISTVGYGHIVPTSLAANLLMTVEAIAGLFSIALVTGLIFARFSRPLAGIVFSRHAIIAPYQEIKAFEFRVANRRRNQIVDLEARVVFSRLDGTGGKIRRVFDNLDLERRRVSFFPLSWTVVHPIDEASPLYGSSRRDLLEGDAEFLVLLTGMDETFSQMVHSRSSYKADEVLWGARYRNIFEQADDSPIAMEVSRIGEVDEAELPE
ncbi:MAG: ion channel [Thermoanaerobaculia bacterium]